VWGPPWARAGGRRFSIPDGAVRDPNAHLPRAAPAMGAPYLRLKARPPRPAVKAHAAASRRWRYATKRLAARVAPPGLWRDRWRRHIPGFDDYIAWLAEYAGLIVSGRLHGVRIALHLGIPVVRRASNTSQGE